MTLRVQTRCFWTTDTGHEIWLVEIDRKEMAEYKEKYPHAIGLPQYFYRHHDGHIELFPEPK